MSNTEKTTQELIAELEEKTKLLTEEHLEYLITIAEQLLLEQECDGNE